MDDFLQWLFNIFYFDLFMGIYGFKMSARPFFSFNLSTTVMGYAVSGCIPDRVFRASANPRLCLVELGVRVSLLCRKIEFLPRNPIQKIGIVGLIRRMDKRRFSPCTQIFRVFVQHFRGLKFGI